MCPHNIISQDRDCDLQPWDYVYSNVGISFPILIKCALTNDGVSQNRDWDLQPWTCINSYIGI